MICGENINNLKDTPPRNSMPRILTNADDVADNELDQAEPQKFLDFLVNHFDQLKPYNIIISHRQFIREIKKLLKNSKDLESTILPEEHNLFVISFTITVDDQKKYIYLVRHCFKKYQNVNSSLKKPEDRGDDPPCMFDRNGKICELNLFVWNMYRILYRHAYNEAISNHSLVINTSDEFVGETSSKTFVGVSTARAGAKILPERTKGTTDPLLRILNTLNELCKRSVRDLVDVM